MPRARASKTLGGRFGKAAKARTLDAHGIWWSQEIEQLSPTLSGLPSDQTHYSGPKWPAPDASAAQPERDAEQLVGLGHDAATREWHGKTGRGAVVPLRGTWVRANFAPAFVQKVYFAGCAPPKFFKVPVGGAESRPAQSVDNLRDGPGGVLSAWSTTVASSAESPEIAFRQGPRDYCVAYGASSAMHHFGDHGAAAALALTAPASLASDDSFEHVKRSVRAVIPGWNVANLCQHDPLAAQYKEPVLLQLVGSDGGSAHSVTTVGDLIFDACEGRALPLCRASLDRCVGASNGATFLRVARAVRLVPGQTVTKAIRQGTRQG